MLKFVQSKAGRLAQLVEHSIHIRDVTGPSPVSSTFVYKYIFLLILLLGVIYLNKDYQQEFSFTIPQTSHTLSLTPTPDTSRPVNISVPFIVQAPFGEWKDPRYQDACEEATVLMAVSWARGENLTKQIAKDTIADMSAYQKNTYGDFRDTSAKDTLARLAIGYFHYPDVEYRENVTLVDIIQEIYKGNLVIAPMNGQALNNPYFTQPGPERHMVLIRGYDPVKKVIITNDPGVGVGENYTYPQNVFYSAIRDYSTGYHIPITNDAKNIIIFHRHFGIPNPSSQ